MTEMFSSEMEVDESSEVGGDEYSEAPPLIMEPQVDLDEELDQNTLEPRVEIDENLPEPHVELSEGTELNEGNVYPFDTLAVEFYEGAADDVAESRNTNYTGGEETGHDFNESGSVLNGLSHDSEDTTNTDVAIHDNSVCDSVDTSLDAGEITMDTSNSEIMDSNYQEESDNMNYKEIQRAYLKDFYSSSAFPSVENSSNSTENSSNPPPERIPLSRFPSIVKVVERAEYETIQILYQLLYQRSAWDTQEILSQRILEFSGFTFDKESEEYYNRIMLLQTLPNSTLVKIGAILCLDQVKNVLSNVGLGRHDLITAIMEFLALPRKKTRIRINNSLNNSRNQSASQKVEPCGCRNNCLSKFNQEERELLATFHTKFYKRKRDLYFTSLITVNKASKRPEEDAKKHRDYKYSYKIKIGKKEVSVCKGGFMMLHNVKMSILNHLQLDLKKGKYSPSLYKNVQYPFIEGQEEPEEPKVATSTAKEASEDSVVISVTDSVEDSSESSLSKSDDVIISKDEVLKVDKETKKSISKKVPAVMVEKIDPSKINSPKKNKTNENAKGKSTEKSPKKEGNLKKKLREFPLVVKSLDDASETLLIDLHFLLFSNSADSNKVKDNILDFDGFPFNSDCEDYDERNEFLQRMSGKLITDVANAFSLGVTSTREETIKNVLSFLLKPDESYLKANTSVPVILSDVELDDIDGFSDSDESITCEVVEKKVECIDLLSSGEDSDKEERKKTPVKKEKVQPSPKVSSAPVTPVAPKPSITSAAAQSTSTPAQNTSAPASESGSSGGVRRLRDFETIRKIVNTHPPEYLVDIYELLFLKKHEPVTLRDEILDFTGFTFEKGSPDYVKRKQVLDRMLYNNVRRVYNTLIHNSTEVKVFSKPTMINEIFQFLFKLPDHDTSVRPLPPGAKTLMPKTPNTTSVSKLKSTPVASAPPTTAPATGLPNQTGKLSDLKRVFQRVACFPCEYLVDVHKLLFMTDCDPKVIRQNIFGFKGFTFSVDSNDFQQRKMYLEYLTFHSLRKISSVLTTRSVDLRNSTKHELASHLTDVLAEYCNTVIDPDTVATTPIVSTTATTPSPSQDSKVTTTTSTPTTTVENIVVTPSIEGIQSEIVNLAAASSKATSSTTPKSTGSTKTTASPKSTRAGKAAGALKISIVETHSISSPSVTTTSPSPAKGSRKRKSQTVRQMVSDKKVPPPPPPPTQPTDFADIHLPEVEQYRQIYGANLNVYPSVPTIAGIASFGSPVPQTFPQIVPQAMTFPLVSPYPQALQMSGVQQPAQMIGLQSTPITMTSPIITQVTSKPAEVIVPADIEQPSSESPKTRSGTLGEKTEIPPKESPSKDKDSEEDGDQPLSALIGHPTDAVLKKQISEIVEKTDLQDITMNGVIQRIYGIYPKFDLSYRKEFIKSTLRTILYKLGENAETKDGTRDSNSPDCSVTTTDIHDSPAP